MMQEYNALFDKAVLEFGTRFYRESFGEVFRVEDVWIIDYKGYKHMLEIADKFYNLEDILMTIEYNIPIKVVREHYDLSLEARLKNKTFKFNLYNFWRMKESPEEYRKKELEDLKASEKSVQEAYDQLEEAIG